MDEVVYGLVFDGSGNLYAGGLFTTAGGVSADRVATWGEDAPVTTTIPSLSHCGMIGFALLLIGSALWIMRFRNTM